MTWFRHLRIKTKMLVSFALVIALIAILAVLAEAQMVEIRNQYALVIKHPVSLEMQLRRFHSEYRNLRRVLATLVLFTGDEHSPGDATLDEAESSRAMALELLEGSRAIISSNPTLTEEERDARLSRINIINAAFDAYYDGVAKPVYDTAARGDAEAGEKIVAESTPLVTAVMEKIRDGIAIAAETAVNQRARAERDSDRTIVLLLIISAATVILAIAIAVLMSNYIGRSLAPLTEFMRHAADGGDISFQKNWLDVIDGVGRNKDELGQAIVAGKEFFGRVTDMAHILERISHGDLTSEIIPLSDRDSIGVAFRRMLGNLNRMCGDITASAMQVAVGASQVTAGAQALSSGSTEQAVTIEELSDTIAGVAERTKQTAGMAEQAAGFAQSSGDSAEVSRRRMEDMLAASGEIREASENIRKITKTIDEIAFQTNILAVNASVEAAHAGKYGKGFSVVASAVRGLAMKSAQAAKETERLIVNCMEKAEVGAAIAEEASKSLAEILDGIKENSRLMALIAVSSGEQSQNIDQINIGISQVSQVVRQNSVTAEESAAASEEMCEQSANLRKLVAKFRLRSDSPSPPLSSPPSSQRARALAAPASRPLLAYSTQSPR